MDKKAGRTYEINRKHTPRGNNHLLAIGIDAYQHCASLGNCVKDVQDCVAVLQQRFNFEAAHTYTLFDTKATRKNILKAFRDVQARVQPQDNLVVYFSGHGDTVHQSGYWIPAEATPGEEDEYISADEIVKRLNDIATFHTFLIVDACFSGALFQTTKNITPPQRSDEVHRSRWGLTASHSRELALDGTAGDNSPFAGCLLAKLRQTPESLSVHDLSTFVINEVRRRTRDTQTPIAQPLPVRGHELGQFVFHLRKDETQDWAAAQQENTPAAYERFLQNHPTGTQAAEARAMLAFLQEEADWEQAKKDHTILAYERYLRAYPNGHYTRLALEAQTTLEVEEAWQRTTRRNTIPAYREFIGIYPHSVYINEAEARIEKMLGKPSNPIPRTEDHPAPNPPKEKKTAPATPGYVSYGIGVLLLLFVVIFFVVQYGKRENENPAGSNTTIDTNTTTLQPERPALDTQKISSYLRDALVYLNTNEPAEAKKALEQAQLLDPANADIKDALVYLNTGELPEAAKVLRKALRQ